MDTTNASLFYHRQSDKYVEIILLLINLRTIKILGKMTRITAWEFLFLFETFTYPCNKVFEEMLRYEYTGNARSRFTMGLLNA